MRFSGRENRSRTPKYQRPNVQPWICWCPRVAGEIHVGYQIWGTKIYKGLVVWFYPMNLCRCTGCICLCRTAALYHTAMSTLVETFSLGKLTRMCVCVCVPSIANRPERLWAQARPNHPPPRSLSISSHSVVSACSTTGWLHATSIANGGKGDTVPALGLTNMFFQLCNLRTWFHCPSL